ncbi:cupin domain-containing protein [Haloarcula sp. H-GB5]
MEHVTLDRLNGGAFATGSTRQSVTDTLCTTEIAINHYRIVPGDGFPGGLHAHMDQEELYLILDGEATVETMDRTVTVAAGQFVRFGPGEFHTGWNDTESELVALAIGAPRETDDIRVPLSCPDCGHGDMRLDSGGAALTFSCPDCDTERRPEPCPDCGHDDLQFTRRDRDSPVVVCDGCDSVFETPPLETDSSR